MNARIKESDWKIFSKFYQVALDRFCKRVIEEVRSEITEVTDGYHDRYLRVYKLIQRRDKILADAFDNPRRSNALILLAFIRQQGLLTEEELMQLSPETRNAIGVIE